MQLSDRMAPRVPWSTTEPRPPFPSQVFARICQQHPPPPPYHIAACNMICQPCRLNILDGSQSWGLHRPDYHNPNDDPELEKCTFCSQLREDVKGVIGSPDAQQEYPAYRWAIRLSPVTRETQPTRYTTITFRPVQVADPSQLGVAIPLKCRNSTSPRDRAKSTTLPTRTFYIFDPTPLSIPSTLPLTTTVSPVPSGAVPQIHKWISTCLNSHPRCSSPASSSFFPTRLLDISNPAHPIYVLHTSPLINPAFLPSPYTTLSHCWGPKEANPPMLRLTAATFGQFTNPSVGIPWNILPKTFQQAIEVARELGVKYIWIDSLCIIQWTPEDEGDFRTEGQLMHKVYRYSFCNIAAVDSRFGGGGLFRGEGIIVDQVVFGGGEGVGKEEEKRERSDILPDLVTVRGLARPGVLVGSGDDEKEYVVLQDIWNSQLLSGMLYTRGWVFQERMLSPRLLHFSSAQIFFDCATTSACEILPDALPLPLDIIAAMERHWREMLLATRDTSASPSTDSTSTHTTTRPPIKRHQTGTADPSLESLWRTAVRKYTGCELTNYGSDRLAAIWGVAKLVRDNLRVDNPAEEYGAGLWTARLDEQLAWKVVDYTKAERMKDLRKWPSWSWASVRGEIEAVLRFGVERRWRVSGFDERDVKMDVDGGEDGDLEPVLKDVRLGVRGVVMPARWKRVGCGLDRCGGDCEWIVEVGGGVIEDATKLHVYPDVRPEGETSCFLLILALGQSHSAQRGGGEDLEDGTGLILELSVSDGKYKEYKRVGTFRVWGVDGDEFDAFRHQATEDFYLV